MDTITQGLLGGAAAQAVCGRKLPRAAWIIGLAAGMAADLDVFIRPASDPLGGLTYHRHFTHALAFIPVGAGAIALPLLLMRRWAGRRWAVFSAALVAYATHGLLDACTAYGTLLWWPFSDTRVAWDLIGIVDPVFSGVLLLGLALSVRTSRPYLAAGAVALVLSYIGLGAWQHHRVQSMQEHLAASRGHPIDRGRVMPTPINLILWRSVYETNGEIFVDAIRAPLFDAAQVRQGTHAARVEPADLPPAPAADAAAALRRFSWFADGYISRAPDDPRLICDLRYGMRPDRVRGLWGLRLPDPGSPAGRAEFVHLRHTQPDGIRTMWQALRGRDPLFEPLAPLLALPERR